MVNDAAAEQRRARERYALRFAAVLVAGVLVYHFTFGLSWSATAVMLVIVAVLGLLLHQYNRRHNRARLLEAVSKSNVQAVCRGCGWRGEMSALRQENDHGGIALLCPVCGHQVGHTHQAHA
jgi:hypothetical protein